VESGELNGFQLVWRFFAGTLRARRISVIAQSPEIPLRAEDGTPVLWAVPVTIEICSHQKDNTEPHDTFVARVADAVYGGSAFLTQLDEAMAGEGFNAMFWESDASRECEVDGQVAKTRLTGTLHVQMWDKAA
jgi:hypothetical protein